MHICEAYISILLEVLIQHGDLIVMVLILSSNIPVTVSKITLDK